MPNVSTPYNFVPLNEEVFFPPWANFVNHDIPFKEGLSGKIDLKITAESPIFIRKPYEENDAEDTFYKDKDGKRISKEFCHLKIKDNDSVDKKKYFIPGSSIRNMLRSVVEIMSFSKLSKEYFNNARFGIRDFQNTDVYTLLNDTTNIKIGYLKKEKNSYFVYDKGTPKKIAQIDIIFKKRLQNGNFVNNNFKDLFDSNWQYNSILKFTKDNGNTVLKNEYKTAASKYKIFNKSFNSSNENIVFTGQPGFNNLEGAKTHEFKIDALNIDNDGKFKISDIAFKDFRFIYGDFEGSNNISVDWLYWKSKLEKNKAIPVFFREKDNQIIDFGLSFLYKMAYKNRVERAISNIQKKYNSSQLDLTEALFGKLNNDEESLKGRITVLPAFADITILCSKEFKIVLSGPKASYYPFYIEQDYQESDKYKLSGSYNSYQDEDVKINGRKRYPLHKLNINNNIAKENQKRVSTFIKPLNKGTSFSTKIVFHNILPAELGALLSALTFHNNKNCHHNIGMAKSFGLGEIKIDVENLIINNQEQVTEYIDYMHCFEIEMSNEIANWIKSDQLNELFTMASINAKTIFSNYSYMRIQDFSGIKRDKKGLPRFSKIIDYSEDVKSLVEREIENKKSEKQKITELLKKVNDKILMIRKFNNYKTKLNNLENYSLSTLSVDDTISVMICNEKINKANINIDNKIREIRLSSEKYIDKSKLKKGQIIKVVVKQISLKKNYIQIKIINQP